MLRWRYGGDLLEYRAVTGRGGVAGGVAIARVRRRGAARELALALVLAPDAAAGRAVVRATVRAGRREADYAIAIGDRPAPTFVPLPGAGPMLTWRAVATAESMPPLAAWSPTLGDIELF